MSNPQFPAPGFMPEYDISAAAANSPISASAALPVILLEWSRLDYQQQCLVLSALSRHYGTFYEAHQAIKLNQRQIDRWLARYNEERAHEDRWNSHLARLRQDPNLRESNEEGPIPLQLITLGDIRYSARFLEQFNQSEAAELIRPQQPQLIKWPLNINTALYDPYEMESGFELKSDDEVAIDEGAMFDKPENRFFEMAHNDIYNDYGLVDHCNHDSHNCHQYHGDYHYYGNYHNDVDYHNGLNNQDRHIDYNNHTGPSGQDDHNSHDDHHKDLVNLNNYYDYNNPNDHNGHDDHDDDNDHKNPNDHDDPKDPDNHGEYSNHSDHDHDDHDGHNDHNDPNDYSNHDDPDDHNDHDIHNDHDDHDDHDDHGDSINARAASIVEEEEMEKAEEAREAAERKKAEKRERDKETRRIFNEALAQRKEERRLAAEAARQAAAAVPVDQLGRGRRARRATVRPAGMLTFEDVELPGDED